MSEALPVEALHAGRLLIAGSTTVTGRALARVAHQIEDLEVVGTDVLDGDWRDAVRVHDVFASLAPTHVIIAAGRSGGIAANRSWPAELMLDNLLVATHVVPAAHRHGVRKLLYLASSCTYPRAAPQPMLPVDLLTGPLEPTSQAYAISKIAGTVLCQAFREQYAARFIVGIAGDVYGPGDDFDPDRAHVVAGLISRMRETVDQERASFTVWGSGRPVRDLIYADDLARACLIALARYDACEPINLSSGQGTSVQALARIVSRVVGLRGDLVFDTSRPDGAPLKVLDATVIRRLGFAPRHSLEDGVRRTYAWWRAIVPGGASPVAVPVSA